MQVAWNVFTNPFSRRDKAFLVDVSGLPQELLMEILGSPWVPLSVLIVLAVVARTLEGSWLAPSAFAGLLWSFYLALPLATNADRISGHTVWLIVTLIACVQVGAFFCEDPARWRTKKAPVNGSLFEAMGQKMLRWSLLLSLAVLLGVIKYMVFGLKRFYLPLSVDGFLNLGGIFYGVLVDGDVEPWWFRLLRMWIFPAALLGGFSFVLIRSKRQKLLTFCPFLPALLLGTAIASRYATGMAIICWLSGYLSMKSFVTRGKYRIGRKFILAGALSFMAAVGMYVTLGVVRGHIYEDISGASIMVRSNLWGYLAVFDHWVDDVNSHELTWGEYTIAGAFDLTGLKARETALGYEHTTLDSGLTSNVYTAFRGLIQDFSFAGSVVLCLLAGMFAGRAYTKLCEGQATGIGTLSGYYAFLLWSPIVSIFNYNGAVLAILVGTVAFRSLRQQGSRRSSRIAKGLAPKDGLI